jgi:HK97 family phage prohead protease
VGIWRGLRARLRLLFSDPPPRPIADVIAEMSARSPRVGRTEALTVPGMLRGRNMICSIATLPLVQVNARNESVRNPLLEQLDPDVANVVTLAQTIEDLIFDSIAWWKITAQDFAGYPLAVRHLDVNQVSLNPPASTGRDPLPGGYDPRGVPYVYVDGVATPADTVIRFDSPNPAVLQAAGRAIRKAILLDKAASMYADDPRPLDYFTPADGADPVGDEDVADILAQWKSARKRRSTAYVPASLKYNSVDSPSPADLQLLELQRQAGLEIANALGIDPEDLGISTTSRTYSNVIDRRQDRINEVLSPYMCAITQRLSMGDVTRRGHRVLFDLDDYLKANPTDRWSVYKTATDIGAITVDEIRAEEDLPPLPAEPAPAPTPASADPAADPAPGTDPAASLAAAHPRATFDGAEPLRFIDVPVQAFTVDRERRIIEGLALPYNATASKYGLKFKFVRGALKWTSVNRVKLLRDHDMSQPIGVAQGLTDTAAGLRVKFKVARGPAGDEALSLAEDGVLDGLSVGVDFDFGTDTSMDPNDESTMLVHRADLRETSLTAMPAFDDARVTKVAASRNGGVSTMDECATCGQRHAPGVACPPTTPNNQPAEPASQPAGITLTDEQARMLLTRPGALQALVTTPAPPQQAAVPAGFTLSAEQLDYLIRNGQIGHILGIPGLGNVVPAQQAADATEQRQTVNPVRTVRASVSEPAPYVFDRRGNLTRGKHDFSTDLIHGLRDGNGEALDRAQQFMRGWFEGLERNVNQRGEFVSQSDAATLNPNVQRPDLYVDQKEFEYPIWNAISKGTINDATPFVLPKFSSSSGLAGAHTENTEPTPGTFVATSQTITPSPVSGKVEISREAWDQGGNPQLSTLIWNQMVRAWFEALEASAVTLLEGLAPTTLTITTAAADAALEQSLTSQLAPLQYVRGGFRFRDFFLQVDLYKALVAAKDTSGRRLFPVVGAQNSVGTAADYFASLLVAGLVGRPAWALAATSANSANSYLFDRGDVSGWATPPMRLTFDNIAVAKVHVGVWGYKALACTDLTGVRRLAYDPV